MTEVPEIMFDHRMKNVPFLAVAVRYDVTYFWSFVVVCVLVVGATFSECSLV